MSQQNQSVLPLLCSCTNNQQLTESDAGVVCAACGTNFSNENGFYDLEPGKEYYWNEFTQEEMRKLLDLGWREGWEAMASATEKAVPVMGELLRSNARLDSIFHCYAPEQAQTCLDIGCGWGTNTEILSHLYDEVWSMDGVSERLEATRIRLENKQIDNVRLVRNFLPRMPFADNTFDMVVIKGVLEWIPLATTEHPTDTQRNFLAEVYRVLKPGGCLLLGIENRFGAQYLMGVPDHSGLYLTSFLPRRLADLAVRWNQRRKSDMHVISHDSTTAYRPYTYTDAGYRKIMAESDFDETDIYWAKSYQVPRYSGPVDGANIRFFLDTTAGKFRRFAGVIGAAKSLFRILPNRLIEAGMNTFTPNFIICGYKGDRPNTLQDQLLSPLDANQTWFKVGGSDAEQGRIQYFILDKNNQVPSRIISFVRFPETETALATEYNCLDRYSHIASQTIDIAGTQNSGRTAWASPYLDSSASNSTSELQQGIDWLAKWQQATRSTPTNNVSTTSAENFVAHVEQVFATVQNGANSLEEKGGSAWGSIAEIVGQALAGLSTSGGVEPCAEHRDFSVSNVRFAHSLPPVNHGSSGNGLSKNSSSPLESLDAYQPFVIDWDLYREEGWPFFDVINYLLSHYAPAFHADSFQGALDSAEFTAMLDYAAQKLSVSPDLLWYMIPYHLARSVIDSRTNGLLYRAKAEPLAQIWLDAHKRRLA